MISSTALAKKLGITDRQLRRLAPEIPGAERCGESVRAHWRFDESSPVFKSWLARRQKSARRPSPPMRGALDEIAKSSMRVVGVICAALEKRSPEFWMQRTGHGETMRAAWLCQLDGILDLYQQLEAEEGLPLASRRVVIKPRHRDRCAPQSWEDKMTGGGGSKTYSRPNAG